jgi:hypothetical protein
MFATRGEVELLRSSLDELRGATTMTAREKVREFAETRKSPERPAVSETKEQKEAKAEKVAPAARQVPKPPGPSRESPVMGIKESIDKAIEQAEESIRGGNLDTAKSFYKRALSMYNQLNQAESYQEANAAYERIRKLYSRLRIYS